MSKTFADEVAEVNARSQAAGDFWERLTAPFPPEDIEWKVTARTKDKSKGLVVPYFDARAVMDRLDDVCGPGGWCAEYRAYGTAWVCRLTIETPDGPLSREDGADATEIEAAKGGISGALKRAFSAFGCRYLYYLDMDNWVELDNGYLPRNFTPPKLPAWALPGGSGRPGDPVTDDERALLADITKAKNSSELELIAEDMKKNTWFQAIASDGAQARIRKHWKKCREKA